MSPTLMHGRLVLFISMQPRVDDIVMLRHDGREKIKRIVQLRASRAYVVGDNELASTDSRHFGWLPAEVIIAKLVWPRKR